MEKKTYFQIRVTFNNIYFYNSSLDGDKGKRQSQYDCDICKQNLSRKSYKSYTKETAPLIYIKVKFHFLFLSFFLFFFIEHESLSFLSHEPKY